MDEDASSKMLLTLEQAKVISTVERAGASLSLVGVVLVIVTFICVKRLRTVPNTFILFASIANIGAIAASLIGLAGIEAGTGSALCNAQAFLLEMFMQSDPWWSFAMAVNVFMVFFFSANPHTFRRYLWVYCVICFGLPMVPAIVCLCIRHDTRGPIYGNATLWCWIDDNWNSLRIFSYYIPIWVCIFLSAVIYVAVGYHVFHQRNQLRNLTLSNQGKDVSVSDVRDSAEKNLTTQPPYYGTVTTEVQVTSTIWPSSSITPPPTPAPWTTSTLPDDDDVAPTTTSVHAAPPPPPKPRRSVPYRLRRAWRHFRAKLSNTDPVKLAYLRTSSIFAVSVFVTWTPSSINRVYTLMYPDRVSYGLNVASAAVLPLQGVWNAVIYFTTSWRIVREEWRLRREVHRRGRLRNGAMELEMERGVGHGVRVGTMRVQKGCELDS